MSSTMFLATIRSIIIIIINTTPQLPRDFSSLVSKLSVMLRQTFKVTSNNSPETEAEKPEHVILYMIEIFRRLGFTKHVEQVNVLIIKTG